MTAVKRGLLVGASLLVISACAMNPQPIDDQARADQIASDTQKISQMSVPLEGSLTLSEAVARAVLFNLDHRVSRTQRLVAEGQFGLAQLEMLPELSLRVQGVDRDPQNASSSRSIFTGQETLEPSTSEDRSRLVGDLTFSWNLLDLGVSYYQAKQEADRAIISDELRRRSLQSLVQDVRIAFWRAAAAEQLQGEIVEVKKLVDEALLEVAQIEEDRLQAPVQTLRFRRSLLDLVSQLEQLSSDLTLARIELLTLMNLPATTELDLELPAAANLSLPSLDADLEALEQIALDQRPELREQIYEGRITANEARKVLVDALPGLELQVSGNYDSNSFLVDDLWRQASATLLGNLVDLATLAPKLDQVDLQKDLVETQRLAVHLAILGQVNIAYRQYQASANSYQRASEISGIEELISTILSDEAEVQAGNPLEQVRAQTSALFAKLEQLQSYADAQASYGRVLSSLGVDVIPHDAYTMELDELTAMIDARLTSWGESDFNQIAAALEMPVEGSVSGSAEQDELGLNAVAAALGQMFDVEETEITQPSKARAPSFPTATGTQR